MCYEKGYGYKSGVKIKSAESKDSIFRTIEKLEEDEMKELSKIEMDGKEKKIVSRDEIKTIIAKEKEKAV